MKDIIKIKNAIKRKVNESRLREKVSSILDDALPNILAEVDQLDQAFLDAKPVKEGGTSLQNKVYDAVTGMSINGKDSFESKFAVRPGKLNDFIFKLSDRDATSILKLIKQRKFEGKIKEEHPHDLPPDDQGLEELDVRKTHGDRRIENPKTGNDIKLRTALKAKKGSAVYQQARQIYNSLKDEPTNERAYASTDGKPYFDYDPGQGKLTEDYSQRARNFRVALRRRLAAMKKGKKIKYGKLTWTALGNGNFKDSKGRTVPYQDIVQDLKFAVKGDILQHRGAAGDGMVDAYLKFEGKLTEAQAMNMDTVPYNTIMKMKPGSTIKMKDGKIRTKDKFGNWRANTDPNDIIVNRDVVKHMKGMKGYNMGGGRIQIESKLKEAKRIKPHDLGYRVNLRRARAEFNRGENIAAVSKSGKGNFKIDNIGDFPKYPPRDWDYAFIVKEGKLNEGSIVTRNMWNRMSDDEKIDALQTAFSDPDDAMKHYEKEWNNLPSVATQNMYIESKLNEDHFKKGQKVKYQLDRGSSKALRPSTGTISKIKKMGNYYQYTIQDGGPVPVWGAEIIGLAETKSAPAGHYFTKGGNVVKGRLSKAARSKGATKSDPKDKQRSKVPPATQRNEEEVNEMASKAQITKAFSEISKLSVAMLLNIEKFKAAKAKGDEKAIAKHRKLALDMQTKKKKMEADLDRMVAGIDKGAELALTEKSKGLWHNIRAKRKRVGKSGMAKPGSKAYDDAVAAGKKIKANERIIYRNEALKIEIVEHSKPVLFQEAEYQGRKVKLNKIMQGDVKKFKVYVNSGKKNKDGTIKVKKVNFGQGGGAKGGTMRIRKSNPKARASFRARHNCDTPGPKTKARYWSCRKW